VSDSRREVGTRKITFFHKLASHLVKLGLTPNQISIASAIFAILGGILFAKAASHESTAKFIFLLAALVCIQLRLICNLIDGLMAVECGLKTASGEIFNDVPDRISDIAFLIGAGIFAQSFAPYMIHVAWLAATFAVLTAYVRILGASMTALHDFSGPMAKQHRMFLLSLGTLGSLVEMIFHAPAYTMSFALLIVALGSLVTCGRRLHRLYQRLEKSK
jgi:phosphatidylglycerophosphate synthase